MEDADGIAQWNASGSRKNSIVAAGSRVEQLDALAGQIREDRASARTGMAKRVAGPLGKCIDLFPIREWSVKKFLTNLSTDSRYLSFLKLALFPVA
jgi:hypothetical protein